MRVLGKKLFENDYQKQLVNLADYTKHQNFEELLPALEAIGQEPAIKFLASMGMWHHRIQSGFSIEDVVSTCEYMRFSRPHQTHPSGVANIDMALDAAEIVVERLIRRANQIAQGIKPGASQELAQAFRPES